MLKLNLFKSDLQKQAVGIKKLVDEHIRNVYQNNYSNQSYDIPAFDLSPINIERIRTDIKLEYSKGSYEKIESVWINPTQIKRIEECHDRLTDERYLRIYMIDDKQYCINENSVEEFLLKNVITGSI